MPCGQRTSPHRWRRPPCLGIGIGIGFGFGFEIRIAFIRGDVVARRCRCRPSRQAQADRAADRIRALDDLVAELRPTLHRQPRPETPLRQVQGAGQPAHRLIAVHQFNRATGVDQDQFPPVVVGHASSSLQTRLQSLDRLHTTFPDRAEPIRLSRDDLHQRGTVFRHPPWMDRQTTQLLQHRDTPMDMPAIEQVMPITRSPPAVHRGTFQILVVRW